MKEYSQKYIESLYKNDSVNFQLLCEQAVRIFQDHTIDVSYKNSLRQVTLQASVSLEAVHDMAVNIQTGALGFRKRKLSKLKRNIDDMGASMSQFRQMVEGLRSQAAAESDLWLPDQDFAVVGPQQDAVVLNDRTCPVHGQISTTRSAEHANTTTLFLLETKPYTEREKRTVKTDMRILSSKLGAAAKGQCILPLLGFRDSPCGNAFQFVFAVSAGESTIFQTLEARYRQRQIPSLNVRIALCHQLAEAVLQTHTLGLVHKRIRPANILLQSIQAGGGEDSMALFLSGWQYARTVDERASQQLGEDALERAIYQHPERQRQHAEAKYCIGHDIYSLGVCMLELLTWSPLVIGQDADERGIVKVLISKAYRDAFEWGSRASQGEPGEWQLWEDPVAVKRTIAHE